MFENVSDGLKRIYKQKLLPFEEYYKFHDFHSPALGMFLFWGLWIGQVDDEVNISFLR